jgi:hypothetical protein
LGSGSITGIPSISWISAFKGSLASETAWLAFSPSLAAQRHAYRNWLTAAMAGREQPLQGISGTLQLFCAMIA